MNVDGHSDSVTLPTSDTASISGSITMPSSLGYNRSSSTSSKLYRGFGKVTSGIPGDVSINGDNVAVGLESIAYTANRVYQVTSLKTELTYNINGSGTVNIYGGYQANYNMYDIIVPSPTEFGYISLKFNKGELISTSCNNLYVNSNLVFYITNVSIS